MWMITLWMVLGLGQIESTEAMLIRARMMRDPAVLQPHRFDPLRCSDLLLQEYLLTLGQIGHPDSASNIEAFFKYPNLRDTALFAYGELDGAPLEPLIRLIPQTQGNARLLLFEGLAKLARDADKERVAGLWQKQDEAHRHATAGFLWRVAHPTITEKAIETLGKQADGQTWGYVYYLLRGGMAVGSELKLRLIDAYKTTPETLMHAVRLKVEGNDTTADALEALCSHKDWRIRVNALSALARADEARLSKPAVAQLLDDQPNVVRNAISRLVGLGWESVDTSLAMVTNGYSPSHIQTMVMGADPERLEMFMPLVEQWPKSEARWQRHQGIRTLGRLHTEESKASLLTTWKTGDSVSRALALGALSNFKELPEASRLAGEALAQDDTFLKTQAVALAQSANLDALLVEAKKTMPETDFHYALIDKLPELAGEEKAHEAIKELLTHDDYLVRLKAYLALPEKKRGDRRQVFQGHWQHEVPQEITRRAASLIRDSQTYLWELETEKGKVVIRLQGNYAPITVANIMHLTEKGYFDGMTLHRVVPNFVVQGGDPRGDGSGGPGYAIPCEVNMLRYARGAVGMALAGKDTGGSQFFICHSPQPHLDGGYTIFGNVEQGMAIVDKLEEGNRILKARIR